MINKAKEACKNAGGDSNDHFPDVRKLIEGGKGAQHQSQDLDAEMTSLKVHTKWLEDQRPIEKEHVVNTTAVREIPDRIGRRISQYS